MSHTHVACNGGRVPLQSCAKYSNGDSTLECSSLQVRVLPTIYQTLPGTLVAYSTTNSRSQRCLRDHDRDKCVLSKLVCNVGRHNSGQGRRGPQTGSPCGPARFLRISISREVSKLRLATTGQCRPCLSRGPERQEMVAPAM